MEFSKDTSHIDATDKVISIRGLEKSFGTLAVLRGIDLDATRFHGHDDRNERTFDNFIQAEQLARRQLRLEGEP